MKRFLSALAKRLSSINTVLKPPTTLYQVFAAICLVIFTVVLGSCVFANSYEQSPFVLVPMIAATVAIVYGAYKLLAKYEALFERNYPIVLCIGLTVLACANLIFGKLLEYKPMYDLGAIYDGAVEWSKSGSFLNNGALADPNYFYWFPNNLGAMSLLFVFFKIGTVLGITDYYAIALISNTALVALTVFLSVLTARKMFGIKASLITLLCFMLFTPFYFMGAVFYTDALSLLFPILVLFCYLKFLEAESKQKKLLFALLIALASAIGALVKFTVIIITMAIILHYLWTKGLLKALALSALCIAVIAGSFAGFNGYMYANQLDAQKAEKMNTPYAHWVMMGLEGNGRYNSYDYEFTRSFDDLEERDRAIAEKIAERIKDRGIFGMVALFCEKMNNDFGDGSLGQADFLDDEPKNDTFLHSFILYSSPNFKAYRAVTSAIYFAFLLLCCIAAYFALRTKACTTVTVPLLCLCGVMLFLSMWEVSARYATNFVPMMILGATGGITAFSESQKTRIRNKQNPKAAAHADE